MSKDMLGIALRKLVTLPGETLGLVCDLLEKLADPEWVAATKKFLRKQDVKWPPKPSLLESISTISVATVERFVTKDYFKGGNSHGVKIAYLSDNLKEHFLPKVEQGVVATVVRVFKLVVASLDSPIITELGSNHETTLAHLWELLKLQPKGESGILLTNGYANIFYIRDTEGTLWAVDASWGSDGWCVNAYSVGRQGGWDADRQVFGC